MGAPPPGNSTLLLSAVYMTDHSLNAAYERQSLDHYAGVLGSARLAPTSPPRTRHHRLTVRTLVRTRFIAQFTHLSFHADS